MSVGAPMGSGSIAPRVADLHARSIAPTLEGPSRPFSGSQSAQPGVSMSRARRSGIEERAAAQLRFRRAFTVGYAIWAAFAGIDWMVVRYLDAPSLKQLAIPRFAVLFIVLPLLIRLYRNPPLRTRHLTVLDLCGYTTASIGIAVMCAHFRGLASPYASGLCLILLARTVTAQDPWRRGLVMSGVPVLAFYAFLFASASFLPSVDAQFHDAAALTTLLLNSAYILGTYVFLVVGGNVVWSLRRQVFEARSLGRYRLKRRLAAGGMGEVWVAYHPGLKRDVAVKILRNEVQMESENAVPRFEREARATAELLHPNTVRVFDYGATEDGLFYYVMELLEGETLAEQVERLGPLPPARAVHIVGQAARALTEAHAKGIVHRDIKPENLFLTSLGGEHDFVKVLDFGIAKVTEEAGATMTRTGWLLGTPLYMSPEAVSGKSADARSDVYALGAVLYFLLCGKPPFETDNPSALVFAQVHRTPPRPSERLGRPLPEDLEAIVMRALRKEPSERYPSAAEFSLALSHCEVAGKWTFENAFTAPSSRPPPRASAPVSSIPRSGERGTGGEALRVAPSDTLSSRT
jgi:serine/threonine-protein kinase